MGSVAIRIKNDSQIKKKNNTQRKMQITNIYR